jgi:hypothetical protein
MVSPIDWLLELVVRQVLAQIDIDILPKNKQTLLDGICLLAPAIRHGQ